MLRTRRTRLSVCLAVGLSLAALTATSASAATRYAAPGGTGADPCSSAANPCSVYVAADGAAPATTIEVGDVVELAPGTYSEAKEDLGPSNFVNPPSGVTIRGEPGKARPQFVLETGAGGWGAFFLTTATQLIGVEIRNQGATGTALTIQDGTAIRVLARSTISTTFTCTMFEGTMLSSACINEAGGGRAIGVSVGTSPGVHASVLRNNTYVATGPGSVAMDFGYFAGADGVIGAVNAIGVIARGGETDVIARGKELSGGKGATTSIELQASAYATTATETSGSGNASVTAIETNGNITAAPLLAEDNVHQLPGSPTIDKGAIDEASDSLDVDGQQREIGLAPDIGADELGNPTTTSVTCQPSAFAPGASSTCTVNVEDVGTVLTQPTGEVTFSSAAGLTVPSSCVLAPDKESNAICSVTVSGGTLGGFQVVAAFGGDGAHEPSEGSTTVTVSQSPSGTGTPPPPPQTKLRKHPPKRTAKRLARFTFTSNQAGSRFECKLDRRPYRGCRSPLMRKLRPGRHVFRVRAVNSRGQRDKTPAQFAWKILPKAS